MAERAGAGHGTHVSLPQARSGKGARRPHLRARQRVVARCAFWAMLALRVHWQALLEAGQLQRALPKARRVAYGARRAGRCTSYESQSQ